MENLVGVNVLGTFLAAVQLKYYIKYNASLRLLRASDQRIKG